MRDDFVVTRYGDRGGDVAMVSESDGGFIVVWCWCCFRTGLHTLVLNKLAGIKNLNELVPRTHKPPPFDN
jgi:hypothetical protein